MLDEAARHVIRVCCSDSSTSGFLWRIGISSKLEHAQLPTWLYETVEQIRSTVRQIIADDSSIVAVGMAVPGPYLVEEGRTALVSSMQGWRSRFFDECDAKGRQHPLNQRQLGQ